MASEEQTTHASAEGAPLVSPTPAPAVGDGIAAAIAVERAGSDPELAADLRNYLQDHRTYLQDQRGLAAAQRQYLDVQMEHLHEQRHLTLVHMRYQHFSDWLSSAWKVLLVILGTGVVLAAGWLVWDASHDKGLVIEAFQVPEDLTAKGYTGTVVAARVLDHLKTLQADSTGNRASSSYSLNWGDNLKVEIPETGVSLGELKNFLHENLGHQTRIGGEIVHTDQGLAIHVRAGDESGERIDGTESELDALTERAAEKIYARTQPYRYATVLIGQGRTDEGVAVLRALATNPKFPATERAWAYQGLSSYLRGVGDVEGARKAGLEAIRMDPELFDGYVAVGVAEWNDGHDELALKYFNQAKVLLSAQQGREDVDPLMAKVLNLMAACGFTLINGDGESALKGECDSTAAVTMTMNINNNVSPPLFLLLHDIAGARAAIAVATQFSPILTMIASAAHAQGVEDWSTAVRLLPEVLKDPAAKTDELFYKLQLAYATARLGDLDAAQQLIDATPADCYPCLRTRGKIAALKKDWPTAEHWFAEAAKQGPSLPFANTEWGEMLLTNGDIDGAIAQCQEAIKRQAHFADPYQYWGEALLLKGDARGAIKQFEQAVKYAPKWGRIQIQWGAALKKLGRDAEAQKKFAVAEALELVPSERALLAAIL